MAEKETKLLPNIPVARQVEREFGDVLSKVKDALDTQIRKFKPENIASKLTGDNFAAMKIYDFVSKSTSDLANTLLGKTKKREPESVIEDAVEKQTDRLKDQNTEQNDIIRKQTESYEKLETKTHKILDEVKKSILDLSEIMTVVFRRDRQRRLAELEEKREALLREKNAMDEADSYADLEKYKKSLKEKGEEEPFPHASILGSGILAGISARLAGLAKSIPKLLILPLAMLKPAFTKTIRPALKKGILSTLGAVLKRVFSWAFLGAIIWGVVKSGLEGYKEGKSATGIIKKIVGDFLENISFGLFNSQDIQDFMGKAGNEYIPYLYNKMIETIKGWWNSFTSELSNEMNEMNSLVRDVFGVDIKQTINNLWATLQFVVGHWMDKLKELVDVDYMGMLNNLWATLKFAAGYWLDKLKISAKDMLPDFIKDENGDVDFAKPFRDMFDKLNTLPDMISELIEALRNKFASIPLIGRLFENDSETKNRLIADAQKELKDSTTDYERAREKSSILDPGRMDEQRALKRMEEATERMETLRKGTIEKGVPQNEGLLRKMQYMKEDNKEVEDVIETRKQQSRSAMPSIINAPSTVVNNQDTIAVIGTGTANNDDTLRMLNRSSFGFSPAIP